MKQLNIGSGLDIHEGYINVDRFYRVGVDVVHDLNSFPYPFEDDEIDEVFASHILEHLDDLPRVMEELNRICKPGAQIIIRVPHFSCGMTYSDPTHKTFFGYYSFDVFTSKGYYGLTEFEIVHRKLNYTRLSFQFLNIIMNPIINLQPRLYERLFCWIIPCSETLITLRVIDSPQEKTSNAVLFHNHPADTHSPQVSSKDSRLSFSSPVDTNSPQVLNRKTHKPADTDIPQFCEHGRTWAIPCKECDADTDSK